MVVNEYLKIVLPNSFSMEEQREACCNSIPEQITAVYIKGE